MLPTLSLGFSLVLGTLCSITQGGVGGGVGWSVSDTMWVPAFLMKEGTSSPTNQYSALLAEPTRKIPEGLPWGSWRGELLTLLRWVDIRNSRYHGFGFKQKLLTLSCLIEISVLVWRFKRQSPVTGEVENYDVYCFKVERSEDKFNVGVSACTSCPDGWRGMGSKRWSAFPKRRVTGSWLNNGCKRR